MAAACRRVEALLHPEIDRRYVHHCVTSPSRRVLIEDEEKDVCLWHSLIACERLHARFVRTLTRT
jgi:hypothetical protein